MGESQRGGKEREGGRVRKEGKRGVRVREEEKGEREG